MFVLFHGRICGQGRPLGCSAGRVGAQGARRVPNGRRQVKEKSEMKLRSKTWMAVVLLTAASAAWAGTAFFKYERACSGFYKICVYDYLGEEVAITIRCVELCPITIEWE